MFPAVFLLAFLCSNVVPAVRSDDTPPSQWQEHWFEHNKLLHAAMWTSEVAIYYDSAMPDIGFWPFDVVYNTWAYTKQIYGNFNSTRLWAVFHANSYTGGHPATTYDASHDYRNTIDVGMTTWPSSPSAQGMDMIIHEIGHIVEGASKGVKNSPAFPLWHDSKWCEIFVYDVYVNNAGASWANGQAQRFYNQVVNGAESFPRAGTKWFANWFYPIYSQYGGNQVLNRYFTLLAQHFPKGAISNGQAYTRNLNLGEFVHFWSGAAKTNLKSLALNAFGPNDEQGNSWTAQFDTARNTFSGITY
jgi:hypothetical protein